MVELGLGLALKFLDNPLGQYFAKFHTPLVERVNLPDGALGEHAVLVEGDQLAEHVRRELLGEDRVRRAVALKYPMGYEPIRRALHLDLLPCLAEGQRLSLSEDVRQEHVVVAAELVERSAERDEVTGDEFGPLMDQLVEGVLAVGSRLAPVDGAGLVGDFRPIKGDVFAVALHRQLLQIGRKSLQVLLVRQYGNRLGTEEVVVPDA